MYAILLIIAARPGSGRTTTAGDRLSRQQIHQPGHRLSLPSAAQRYNANVTQTFCIKITNPYHSVYFRTFITRQYFVA